MRFATAYRLLNHRARDVSRENTRGTGHGYRNDLDSDQHPRVGHPLSHRKSDLAGLITHKRRGHELTGTRESTMRTEVSHRTIFFLRADHGAAESRPYGIRLPLAVRTPHRFRVVLAWNATSPPRRCRGSRLFITGEPAASHIIID